MLNVEPLLEPLYLSGGPGFNNLVLKCKKFTERRVYRQTIGRRRTTGD